MAIRTNFIHDLAEVQRALLLLSESVQRSIAHALGALQRNDVSAARRVVREDDDIDERRASVEERVLQLIAAQQPAASDLRFLLSAVRIANDLERIGDYAEGIAALVIRDAALPALDPPAELQLLADHVQTMLKTSVAAFVERDPTAPDTLEAADDRADDLNRDVQSAMLSLIQTQPVQATRALHYLFVGHNLERIADRAVNIAEQAAFIATGVQPAHHRHRSGRA